MYSSLEEARKALGYPEQRAPQSPPFALPNQNEDSSKSLPNEINSYTTAISDPGNNTTEDRIVSQLVIGTEAIKATVANHSSSKGTTQLRKSTISHTAARSSTSSSPPKEPPVIPISALCKQQTMTQHWPSLYSIAYSNPLLPNIVPTMQNNVLHSASIEVSNTTQDGRKEVVERNFEGIGTEVPSADIWMLVEETVQSVDPQPGNEEGTSTFIYIMSPAHRTQVISISN
jgi:hypothetical protein